MLGKMVTVGIILFATLPNFAIAKPAFFSKEKETFKIVNEKADNPTFKVFSTTLTQQALALAVNTALKLPTKNKTQTWVDVKLEEISFQKVKSNSQLASISIQASQRNFPLDPHLKISDLKSGKRIEVKIPNEEFEIGVFTTQVKGHFSIQYIPASDSLLINNAWAYFSFENFLGVEEVEEIRFSGRGIRK